jgi:hypothetical protein
VAWLAATVAIYTRMQMLIQDDWGCITPLTAEQLRDCWRSSMTDTAAHPASGISVPRKNPAILPLISAPHTLRVNSRRYHKSWENSLGSG